MSSGYTLGARSRRELIGVRPELVGVVERAIQITEQDFAVHDGLRTVAEQRRYVAKGVSQTMDSMHLPQADGYGYAVDLVPYINGKVRWEWPAIYPIAEAVRRAATELGVRLVWGGCWQTLNGTTVDPERLVQEYGARRRAQGRRAFTDGPHYELER